MFRISFAHLKYCFGVGSKIGYSVCKLRKSIAEFISEFIEVLYLSYRRRKRWLLGWRTWESNSHEYGTYNKFSRVITRNDWFSWFKVKDGEMIVITWLRKVNEIKTS